MIGGANRGAGGAALPRHLLSTKDGQQVLLMPSRGLAAEGLKDQIAEITADAAHGRTDRPIHHLHVDPPPDARNPNQIIGVFLRLYEAEFGLQAQQRAGVFHLKKDRVHAHVVYSLVRENGRVVDLSHEFRRREKVCRVTEFECGLRLVKGAHNRAVEQALRAEGRSDVADAMIAAGLLDGPPGIAHSTPRQRAQAERTGVPIDELRAETLAAWRASDDAKSFAVALHAFGSTVANGAKGLLLIDRSGSVHSLNRTLAAATRAARENRITAAAVRRRLDGIRFPPLEEARSARSSRPDTERSDRSERGRTASAPALGVAGGRERGDRPSRRTEGAASGDPGNPISPPESTPAHRKRLRDRAAALALSSIDLQAINQKRGEIMKELKTQEYKAKLLADIAPQGFNGHPFALDLHMIKAPTPEHPTARILMKDGGWIEINRHARSVRTWGRHGKAQGLAQALAASIGCEPLHLAKTASIAADVSALKVSKASEDTVKSLVVWWTMNGYPATAAPDGCWVNAGRARILDSGNRMEIHGGLTDEAVEATILKAKEHWGGGVFLDGFWTQAEQDHLWLAATRAGVTVENCTPSPEIQEAWHREEGKKAKEVKVMSAVTTEIGEAQRLLEAAKGNIEAAKSLPGSLQAFIAVYLDDSQRKELAAQPVAEIVPHLHRFREIGAAELATYDPKTGRKIAFADLEKENSKVSATNSRAPS
jgi:hypothetical protein